MLYKMFFVVISLLGATAEIFDLTTPRYATYNWMWMRNLISYIPAGHPALERIDPTAT